MFVLEEDLFHSYVTCSLDFEPDLLSLNRSITWQPSIDGLYGLISIFLLYN